MPSRLAKMFCAALAFALLATPILAQTAPQEGPAIVDDAGYGRPAEWQVNLQYPVTPVAEAMHDFNIFVLVIIAAITLFVFALMAIVVVRYRADKNPTPTRTTHNTAIEIVWTVVPVLILVVIAVPSFRILFAQYDIPKTDLTIKAVGKQWFWTYEYQGTQPETPGQAVEAAAQSAGVEFAFDSLMVPEAELKPGQPRLLAVDNDVVVPVGKVVRILVTAADVIHNWNIPSFGVKADAVPGRINELWFRADREGIYYGQCMELCGRDHAFMPIAVRVVSEAAYQAWAAEARQRFAVAPSASDRKLAAAGAAAPR